MTICFSIIDMLKAVFQFNYKKASHTFKYLKNLSPFWKLSCHATLRLLTFMIKWFQHELTLTFSSINILELQIYTPVWQFELNWKFIFLWENISLEHFKNDYLICSNSSWLGRELEKNEECFILQSLGFRVERPSHVTY